MVGLKTELFCLAKSTIQLLLIDGLFRMLITEMLHEFLNSVGFTMPFWNYPTYTKALLRAANILELC